MSNTKDFDVKRNEILDCAAKLFMTKGYESTSVNTILKEIGIAKGTFYYYFDSKEEVMDGVVMRFVDEELKYAQSILADDSITPIEKLIKALFKQNQSDNEINMVKQMYEANNALMKQRALQRTLEIICPIYAEIISQGNEQQIFSSKTPLADIQFLLAGVQTLYDLSHLENAHIKVNQMAILETFFQVLGINETKISKNQISKLMEE
ncbi:TetR/AcrR family transcriptional regulator [Enterococcus sp. LJL99]